MNIAQILKRKNKGTILYSPLFGEVEFIEVDYQDNTILVKVLETEDEERFFEDGKYFDNYRGKCLLFPSATQQDWSKELSESFKKGDIIVDKDTDDFEYILLFNRIEDNFVLVDAHMVLDDDAILYVAKENEWCDTDLLNARLATDDEINLFTKELEKQTTLTWNKQTMELEAALKPFTQVLGRDDDEDIWTADLFSYKDPTKGYPYCCIGEAYRYCIPYAGNENLLGTSNK